MLSTGKLKGQKIISALRISLFKHFQILKKRSDHFMVKLRNDWVACMGNYFGTFVSPFRYFTYRTPCHIRFHEFYKFDKGKVVEIKQYRIYRANDAIKLMANGPQLGKFICTPGPISGDGLYARGDGNKSMLKIKNMLTDLCKHQSDPNPKAMKLEKYWHPQFNWYGPAGIGTSRGISGFRNWHQIPFKSNAR